MIKTEKEIKRRITQKEWSDWCHNLIRERCKSYINCGQKRKKDLVELLDSNKEEFYSIPMAERVQIFMFDPDYFPTYLIDRGDPKHELYRRLHFFLGKDFTGNEIVTNDIMTGDILIYSKETEADSE